MYIKIITYIMIIKLTYELGNWITSIIWSYGICYVFTFYKGKKQLPKLWSIRRGNNVQYLQNSSIRILVYSYNVKYIISGVSKFLVTWGQDWILLATDIAKSINTDTAKSISTNTSTLLLPCELINQAMRNAILKNG